MNPEYNLIYINKLTKQRVLGRSVEKGFEILIPETGEKKFLSSHKLRKAYSSHPNNRKESGGIFRLSTNRSRVATDSKAFRDYLKGSA